MTEEDDPGPTRNVRVLRPLPVARSPAQRIGAERKDCLSADGSRFGPYALLGEVGKGGMAEVRLAIENVATGALRICVVKRARKDANEEMIAALRDEATLLERLRHPGIVELYRAGELDGVFFLAFELVDGISLRQLMSMIAPAPVPVRVAMEIGVAVARALAFAHAAPSFVVHRDVTPQNVLVARGGAVKLLDFGIARFQDRPARTKAGTFKGKLGYIAPEQLDRRGELGAWTDVFMLGLVLTELISGARVLPQKLLVVAETESLIRERCARADELVPLEVVDLLVAMTQPEPRARPEMITVASELSRQLAQSASRISLADFVQQRALAKLLPLDLESIFDLPTRPVSRRLELDDEDAYSKTIDLLTAARFSAP